MFFEQISNFGPIVFISNGLIILDRFFSNSFWFWTDYFPTAFDFRTVYFWTDFEFRTDGLLPLCFAQRQIVFKAKSQPQKRLMSHLRHLLKNWKTNFVWRRCERYISFFKKVGQPRPLLLFIFQTLYYRRNCWLLRDSNSDRWSRRWAR